MGAAKLNEIASLAGHKDAVTALGTCEAANAKLLFSSSRDRKVLCWCLSEGEGFGRILKEFAKHGHNVNDVAVAKSENFIVTAGADGLGRIIDAKTGERIFLRGHASDVMCAAINFQENKIVTGSADRTINLWNTRGELLKSFGAAVDNCHGDWVTRLEFRPFDENEIVSGSADGKVKIWDVDAGVVKATFFDGALCGADDEARAKAGADGSFAVRALTLSADGNCCAYGGSNGKVYVLNLADNELITTFEADSPVCSLAFGLTEATLACGTKDKIFVWDVMNADLLTVADISHENKAKCTSLVWSVNNLVAGLSNGKIVVFEFVR